MAFVAPFPGGGLVIKTFQASAIQQIASLVTSMTFSGVAIGTAASNRYVVVSIGGFGTHPPTGCTIGGVVAMQAVAQSNGIGFAQIWYALIPGGTTANIVFTFASSIMTIFLGAYSMTGNSLAAPFVSGASVADPASIALANLPAASSVFSAGFNGNTGTSVWSGGVSQDANSTSFSADFTVASGQNLSGNLTLGCTYSGAAFDQTAVAAAWAP